MEDDEELKRIREEYGSGRMLTGEVKKILIGEVQALMRKRGFRAFDPAQLDALK